jgi:hypothetical protein
MSKGSDRGLHFIISEYIDGIPGRVENLAKVWLETLHYQPYLYVAIGCEGLLAWIIVRDHTHLHAPLSNHYDFAVEVSYLDVSSVLSFEFL